MTLRPTCLLWVALAAGSGPTAEPLPQVVEFNRDVRPILSDNCFQCHGPDTAKRKADLRLDTEEGARAVLVPRDLDKSELYQRITADESERMPPTRSGRKLTSRQVALLRAWIEQGARWQKHWSFEPVRRPVVPAVTAAAWVRNPIDAFILARLEREGLAPSPETDRTTLLRRVTLDLTGLPPTPEEVDAFLADQGQGAYERAVDRLLASPRYGERMAIGWLDAARYADSNGYQSDGERIMWRWRDWVIEAFNANLPFDRFTVEQLAGDLLPGPTLEQRIATGFNRNHRGNAEGGIIPEEYAVEYVVDRVDTTTTVWLGLTVGCARCHDHKFDPIGQKDYYRLFALFNNVPERGKAIKYGNSPPMIPAPTRQQRQRLADLDTRLASARAAFERQRPAIDAHRAAWEKTLSPAPLDWTVREDLAAGFPRQKDGPGPLAFDGKTFVDAGDVGDFGFYDKFTLSMWVYAEGDGVLLSRTSDEPQAEGYALQLAGGKVQLNLVKRWLDDALRMETAEALERGCWHHVAAVYDGSRVAAGVSVYVDGRKVPMKVLLDDLNQTFETKAPLRLGGGGGPEQRFKGRLDDVRIYNRALDPDEVEIVATPQTINEIAHTPAARRTPAQSRKLAAFHLRHQAPEPARKAWGQVAALERGRRRLVEGFPTAMVMQEAPKPRDTFVLDRGQYDRPREKVTAGVPASLPAMPPGKADRLAFARWLVSADNPLTARVAVNRAWQHHFGVGLVKTAEDFGLQGESPTHPELLDWLAAEFARTWDLKALHRLIVTSAAYRQSSRLSPELSRRDSDNRLLGRGPRLRLPAEGIRDQALFVSGLLAERLGGASVKPYQPAGLWEELASVPYKRDEGEGLYRRSLYTFWKRTVPPPGMAAFDAPPREACTVARSRTNTPLQALALLNDVTFVEAARALAGRVLREQKSAEARLTRAFRLATGRTPKPAELAILKAGLDSHLARYRKDPAAARKLVAVGESRPDPAVDVAELAAYTAVAGLVLNLDEVITRE